MTKEEKYREEKNDDIANALFLFRHGGRLLSHHKNDIIEVLEEALNSSVGIGHPVESDELEIKDSPDECHGCIHCVSTPNCVMCKQCSDCQDQPKWKAEFGPICYHNIVGVTEYPEICAENDCKCACHQDQPEELARITVDGKIGIGVTDPPAKTIWERFDEKFNRKAFGRETWLIPLIKDFFRKELSSLLDELRMEKFPLTLVGSGLLGTPIAEDKYRRGGYNQAVKESNSRLDAERKEYL